MGRFSKKLALTDAINFAMLAIRSGSIGLFIQTEFGEIGLEVRRSEGIRVTEWSKAPCTEFWQANRDLSADWYVGMPHSVFYPVTVNRSRNILHIATLSRAFIECMVRFSSGRKLSYESRRLIDAATLKYLVSERSYSETQIAHAVSLYRCPERFIESSYIRDLRSQICENLLYQINDLSKDISKLEDEGKKLFPDLADTERVILLVVCRTASVDLHPNKIENVDDGIEFTELSKRILGIYD